LKSKSNGTRSLVPMVFKQIAEISMSTGIMGSSNINTYGIK
jgi:hypothetical protein